MKRSEAIQILDNERKAYIIKGCKLDKAIDMAIEALSERTGKWIDVNGDGSLWRCDQCKDTACCKGNFCPNCGTRMTPYKGGDSE